MTRHDHELGTVRLCPRCGEWLPLDVTFWYRRTKPRRPSDTWYGWCRACLSERSRPPTKADTLARKARRLGPEGDAMRAGQRAASKRYYWRNPQLVRERVRQARAAKAAAEGRTIRVGFGRPRIAA